ncbi:alpha/beta hydrolase [Actinoallomurus sp. NPDC050550]|uniref:alpha/beta fold hydrolase n=1 Tax=Actinoallomurus sp. NPDC050550 TaxID=3154937 RepID=UPI0033CA462D
MPEAVASFSEHTVMSGNVELAVRDHGGSGDAVVLLHGGGRSMEDWRLVVPPLVEAGLRVVTADLRGHGGSGPGMWSWEAGLKDLAAVVGDRGLDRPAVVGHSLGGLVAALWATRHPECPLAVNLDGHTNPIGPFAGLDAEAARAAEATMRDFLESSVRQAGDPTLARLVAELGNLDLFATYRAARCPLVVVASAGRGMAELLPSNVAAVFPAYQRGFAKELSAAEAVTPLLSVVDVDTGHDVHLEDADQVVRLVLDRLVPETRRTS